MSDLIPIDPIDIRSNDAINQGVDRLRSAQALLTDEQRLWLWGKIQNGYCEYCGRPLKPEERCHCENDE